MKKILIALMPLLLVGCMKQSTDAIQKSTSTATEDIGCTSLQSKVFDSMYSYLDQEQATPDLLVFKSSLNERIDQIIKDQKITDLESVEEFKKEFSKVFDILILQSKELKNVADVKEHLQTLIELEMQDQSTSENRKLNQSLDEQFSKVSALSQSLSLACNDNTVNSDEDVETEGPKDPSRPKRMVTGMNNVISTAYQSCTTLQIPEISAETPDVVGITRLVQNHPDGIGGRRIVSNLSAVQATHPYVKVAGNSSSSSCFNVSTNPLIYDYGGSPSVANNKLNYFKDAGSGTSVLGVDCSALVSSAAALGGLRYKPGLDNKAIYIRQTSSKFISASASNFTCYKNITITPSSSIAPGDIAAVSGHVLMIDRVGADPFGLKRLSNFSSCSSIDSSYFDFSVAQSSPSKNGLGINKYAAKDYLNESPKMKTLFTEMGKAACKAYFLGTSSKPNSSSWGVIRHLGTSECLAPKIQMVGQSCVSQCQM